MANVLNRQTKQYRESVNTPDYPVADWIANPNMTPVNGWESKYWTITGDTVSLMTQSERDQVDSDELATATLAAKEAARNVVDGVSDQVNGLLLTAVGTIVQDELRGIKSNNPRASRTMDEIKLAMKEVIDNV